MTDSTEERIQEGRGTCPRCGSGEVTHVMFGMPAFEDYEQSPPWVEFAGCVVEGARARYCDDCGHGWDPPDEEGVPK